MYSDYLNDQGDTYICYFVTMAILMLMLLIVYYIILICQVVHPLNENSKFTITKATHMIDSCTETEKEMKQRTHKIWSILCCLCLYNKFIFILWWGYIFFISLSPKLFRKNTLTWKMQKKYKTTTFNKTCSYNVKKNYRCLKFKKSMNFALCEKRFLGKT